MEEMVDPPRMSNNDDSGNDSNSDSNSINNSTDTEDDKDGCRRDRIVESLYQHLVRSVCVDVASNLHRLVKTQGYLPTQVLVGTRSSMLHSLDSRTGLAARRKLYADLYPNQDGEGEAQDVEGGASNSTTVPVTDIEIKALLQRYAVETPVADLLEGRLHRPPSSSSSSSLSGMGDATVTMRGNGAGAGTIDIAGDFTATINKNNNPSDMQNQEHHNHQLKKFKDDDSNDDEMENNDEDEDEDEEYKMEDDDDKGDDEEREETYKKKSAAQAVASSRTGTRFSSSMTTPEDPTGNTDSIGAPLSQQQQQQPQQPQMDIWGNYHPKEPKDFWCVCQLCGRHISTSRFANHLDKCMGLSTRPLNGSSTSRG